MKKVLLLTILFLILSSLPSSSMENGVYVQKLIFEHLPNSLKQSVEVKLYTQGGKNGSLTDIPYEILVGEKLNLKFNDGELKGNNYKGNISYNLKNEIISGELNFSTIDLSNSILLKKLFLRVDLYSLLFCQYNGKVNFIIGSKIAKITFSIKSNPYNIGGYLSYTDGKIDGKLDIRWRYKYIPEQFYFAHFLNDSFSKRKLEIFFKEEENRLIVYIPEEENIKKLTLDYLNGKNVRFRKLYGDMSLNPVLNACTSILRNRKIIFKNSSRYYFNLINIKLPNYLVVTKNLPIYGGNFTDYKKIDLETFIEQVVYEYLNRKYMVNFENYYIEIPSVVKKKLELSFFDDIKVDELKNINNENKLVLLYFIYRNSLESCWCKLTSENLNKISLSIQETLLKLIKKDSSFRIMNFDKEAQRRIFYYSLLYFILDDSLKKNNLEILSNVNGKPLILNSLARKIEIDKLGEKEKSILFYFEREKDRFKTDLIFGNKK